MSGGGAGFEKEAEPIYDDWEVCPDCQGDEGRFDLEKDDWVDCPTCQGSGGWSKL